MEKDNELVIQLVIRGWDNEKLKKINWNGEELNIQNDSNAEKKNAVMEILEELNKQIPILRSPEAMRKADQSRKTDKNDVLLWHKKKLSFGNIVGCYRNPKLEVNEAKYDVTVVIGSRMDKGDQKCFFLSTMLLEACNYKKRIPSSIRVPEEADDLFDFVFVFRFIQFFKDAFKKQGYFRAYQKYESNDSRLKGSIDISRHIKCNMGSVDRGRIYCRYTEKTVDNSYNHFLLHTYEFIQKFYPDIAVSVMRYDIDFRKIIMELRCQCRSFESSNLRKLMGIYSRPLGHPYYRKYDELRSIAMDVLRRKGWGLFGKEGNCESYSLFYYMPDLWEDFLAHVMKDSLPEGITMNSQEEIQIVGTPNKKDNELKYAQNTRPDFVFYKAAQGKESTPFLIMDAKFKPGWEHPMKGEPLNGFDEESGWSWEFLSDYDKCIRDMVSISAHAAGVIFPYQEHDQEEEYVYPEDEESAKNKYFKRISKYNEGDRFISLPFLIPKVKADDDYMKWRGRLNEYIKGYNRVLQYCFSLEKR